MVRIGFHMSIAGSIANAPVAAQAMGCGTFQMFTSSSRSWRESEISGADEAQFKAETRRSGAIPFAHIPYLCNPSSTNREVYEKSRRMLAGNLSRCRQLGIRGLVVHIGSHLGAGIDAGISNACAAVSGALDVVDGVDVLLENTAGYSNSVGSSFTEIGKIIDGIGSRRVGVCLDTCHAFASGYDLRTAQSIEGVVEEFDSRIGLRRLGLVHLNDAKFGLGSHLDRHWHIGKGTIGRSGFVALFRNKAFQDKCFVMETPINEYGNEATNLKAAQAAVRAAGLALER